MNYDSLPPNELLCFADTLILIKLLYSHDTLDPEKLL